MNKITKLAAITLSLAMASQAAATENKTLDGRIKTHSRISTALSCLNDQELIDLLKQSKTLGSGYGTTHLVTIDGTSVVVKMIPLTDLERKPENILSTANIFDLPLFYQYKVGSEGFGVWRELAANEMATKWVLSGECPNFAMMYHHRVLESAQPEPMNAEELKELKKDVEYWNNSLAVENRMKAVRNASAHVVLFLECIPQEVGTWLADQIKLGGASAQSAITLVDEQLKTTIAFMNSHGLMHFDAHFGNILTDGTMIYFIDFGLSISSKFQLTPAEIEFLKEHRNYDKCVAAEDFVDVVISSLFGTQDYTTVLQEYLRGERGEVSPFIAEKIKKYASTALATTEFFQKLRTETKTTPYPADQLDKLCAAIK